MNELAGRCRTKVLGKCLTSGCKTQTGVRVHESELTAGKQTEIFYINSVHMNHKHQKSDYQFTAAAYKTLTSLGKSPWQRGANMDP